MFIIKILFVFSEGIGHGDDLMYLFSMPSYFYGEDVDMVHRMTTLYTNFAIWG